MVEHMVTIRISESQKETLEKFRNWVKLTHKGRYYGVFGDEVINALETYIELKDNPNKLKERKTKFNKKDKLQDLNLELKEKLGDYLLEIEEGKGISKEIFNNIFEKMFLGYSKPSILERKKQIYLLNQWQEFNNKIVSKNYMFDMKERLNK